MGCTLRVFVPSSPEELAAADGEFPFEASQVFRFWADQQSFIAQVFPVWKGSETVPRQPLPTGFRLLVDDEPVSRYRYNGEPLYYVLAGDFAKVECEELHPLDAAMMAYIRELPPEHPLIPYVV